MIGAEGQAGVAAAHLVLSVYLAVTVWRIVRHADPGRAPLLLRLHWPAGVAVFLWGLMVERAYYVAARLAAPDVDLWQMHPAPAALSVAVIATLFAAAAPLTLSGVAGRRARQVRLGWEAAWVVGLWLALVWWLS